MQRFLTFQFVCLGWVFFNATGHVAGLRRPRPHLHRLGRAVPAGHAAARRHRPRHHRRPVRAPAQRGPAAGGVLPPAYRACRSGCSASPCSASPPSVRSASRPSSTTASDDGRPHTAPPRGLGVAAGVARAPARRAGTARRRPGAGAVDTRPGARRRRLRALVPALRADPAAQRPGLAGRHAPHGQPRHHRAGRGAQPRPAAVAHRLGHGHGRTGCRAGRSGSRRRDRGPTSPRAGRAGVRDDAGQGWHRADDADDRAPQPEAAHRGQPAAGPDRGRLHRPRHGRTAAVRPGRHRRRQRGARRPREHGADPARLLQLAGGADSRTSRRPSPRWSSS